MPQVPNQQRRRAAPVPPKRPSRSSWEGAVEAFLLEKRRSGCTPSTLRTYQMWLEGQRVTQWRADYGIRLVGDTTVDSLRHLEVELVEAGLSPFTVRQAHRTLAGFARWCDDEGLCDLSRVLTMRAPKVPQLLHEVFSERDLERLHKAARSERDRFLMEFLLATGLRAAEVCAVTVEDVIQSPDGWVVRVRQGKGRKDRIVPLETATNRMGRRYRQYLAQVRPRDTRRQEVFLTSRKDAMTGDYSPMQPGTLRPIFRRLQDDTGVKTHAHKFRHTALTRAANAGVHPLQLQRVAGHTSLQTTSLYYTAATGDLVRAWRQRQD